MNWEKFTRLLLDNADKYFLIAASAFVVFYIWLKKKITYKKIQQSFPKSKDYWREIFFSVLPIIIFSFPPLFMLYSDSIRPHTTFYTDIGKYGWIYAILAFPLMLLIHDTYFYWIHRLMHYPQLFKLFHLVHHKSNNPSPWAAYAFHPLEAVLESLIFVIFLFTLPVHSIHLMPFSFSVLYTMFMVIWVSSFTRKVSVHIGLESGSIPLFPTICITNTLMGIMACILQFGIGGWER